MFFGISCYIYGNKTKTLLITAAFFLLTVSRIGGISIDTSTEGMFHPDDPALLNYNEFREQFGRDEIIIVAVKTENVFDLDFLNKFRTLHNDLSENVPYVEKITSLINVRHTYGKKDALIVEKFLEKWPKNQKEADSVKKAALENPFYRNIFFSEDLQMAAIVVQPKSYSSAEDGDDFSLDFDTSFKTENKPSGGKLPYLSDAENSRIIKAVDAIKKKYDGPDFKIYLAGSPVVTHFLKISLFRNTIKFTLLAVVLVFILLFFLYRNIFCVIGVLIIVFFSLLSTVGLMAWLKIPIKTPTQILPTFIAVVGVCDAVHILAIFFLDFGKTGDKKKSICFAMGHSALAVIMTSLTTAAGLFSFSTAEIAPIADLGIFAGVGVILAMLYTIVLLPAYVACIPLKVEKNVTRNRINMHIDVILEWIGRISTKYPYHIIAAYALIIVLSICGMTKIRFSHDPIHWFAKDNDVRIATETIDMNLKGSVSLEVLIDTRESNGLYNPDVLNRIDGTTRFLENLKTDNVYVGKVLSVNTVIKEINRALNHNDMAYYTIPQDKKLIAQELLLFENSGSDDLEDFADSRLSKTRITIRVPVRDAASYTNFLKLISDHFQKTYPDEKVSITGIVTLLFTSMTNVLSSMARSYRIAIVVITILMIILIGRVRIGLLSMIPNITPIVMIMGVMGWNHIRMTADTMVVGSIALGLAVDDTIHFMHNFRRYFEKSNDVRMAVRETLHTTGRAMLSTTILLSLGSFIFMFAELKNIFQFGMLMGITAVFALASDFFLAPALLFLANKKGRLLKMTVS